jgi:hypothetical protein
MVVVVTAACLMGEDTEKALKSAGQQQQQHKMHSSRSEFNSSSSSSGSYGTKSGSTACLDGSSHRLQHALLCCYVSSIS